MFWFDIDVSLVHCTGTGNPCGLRVRVLVGRGTGCHIGTRTPATDTRKRQWARGVAELRALTTYTDRNLAAILVNYVVQEPNTIMDLVKCSR